MEMRFSGLSIQALRVILTQSWLRNISLREQVEFYPSVSRVILKRELSSLKQFRCLVSRLILVMLSH